MHLGAVIFYYFLRNQAGFSLPLVLLLWLREKDGVYVEECQLPLKDFDPVYTREKGTTAYGTAQFHTSCVHAKQFKMVPEVATMEEECVLNEKKSIFLGYLAREITTQTKESSLIFISVLFWFRPIWFYPFTLEPNGTVPNGRSFSGAKRARIVVPPGTVPTVLV